MSIVYLEREEGRIETPLSMSGYLNLLALITLYRKDTTGKYIEEAYDDDDCPQQVGHLWDGELARALAESIDEAVADTPADATVGGLSRIDASLFDYWSGRREMLSEIAEFARQGPFKAFIDV